MLIETEKEVVVNRRYSLACFFITAGLPLSSSALVAGCSSDAIIGEAPASIPDLHRPTELTCSHDRPAGRCTRALSPQLQPDGIRCLTDGDCTKGTNGRCDDAGFNNHCACSYDTCFADDDCAGRMGPCDCGLLGLIAANPSEMGLDGSRISGVAATCTAGNCRIDEDCGLHGYCSPSSRGCGDPLGFFCHTAKDKCGNDGDCAHRLFGSCLYDARLGFWDCLSTCNP